MKELVTEYGQGKGTSKRDALPLLRVQLDMEKTVLLEPNENWSLVEQLTRGSHSSKSTPAPPQCQH